MNTTKTELLEEFDEEFGYLVLSKSGLPYCDVKYIRDRDKRIKQHFNKALDRYRDSVVEEEREKINKYGRKYNKYPSRMLRSKHRYHKRINKKFNNCNLCREEI